MHEMEPFEIVPERYRLVVLGAFRGRPITKVLQRDRIVYRFWGGKSREEGSPWFAATKYARPGNAKRFLALPDGNTAESVSTFKIPKGTVVLASMIGEVGFGPEAQGGGIQVYLPDPGKAILIGRT